MMEKPPALKDRKNSVIKITKSSALGLAIPSNKNSSQQGLRLSNPIKLLGFVFLFVFVIEFDIMLFLTDVISPPTVIASLVNAMSLVLIVYPILYFPVFRPLTQQVAELKRRGEVIEKEKARDEAILESIGDGVVVIDQNGTVLMMNRAAQAIFGCQGDEVLGKKFFNVWRVENETNVPVSNADRPLAKVLNTSRVVTATNLFYICGQKKTPVAMTVAPIILNKEIIGAIDVFRDITKQKEAEQAKNDFVSMASHELRTPMTALRNVLSMMLEGDYGSVGDDLKAPLTDMSASVEVFLSLVNDMLSVSRLEAGKLQVTLVPVMTEPLVNGVVGALKPLSVRKGVLITVEFYADQLVKTDPEKVVEILTNLVSNAIKFTEKGKIVVSAKAANGTLQISVRDTGIGIAPADQSLLFNKFQQISNRHGGRPAGTGLGLYIARLLAKKIGGDLWLESSAVDKGSTFTFSLPLATS